MREVASLETSLVIVLPDTLNLADQARLSFLRSLLLCVNEESFVAAYRFSRLTEEYLRQYFSKGELALIGTVPGGAILVDLREGVPFVRENVYKWCLANNLVCPPRTALVHSVDFSPALLRFLQQDPNRLRSLTPEEFERFVADRLDRMGMNVKLTGHANRSDGGIDLIATPKTGPPYVVAAQMKHHEDRKTGREAVDRLLSWKNSHIRIGLLVTNTAFTSHAVWAAQMAGNQEFIRLRDFEDLKRWLADQYGSEEDWREIPDRIELAPGLVVDVPKPKLTNMALPDGNYLQI